MKKFLTNMALVLLAALPAAAQQPATSVTYTTLGNKQQADGKYCHTMRFTVSGDLKFPRLAFNRFVRTMRPTNPADTLVEVFPGYYYVATPRLAAGRDTVNIDIVVNEPLYYRAYTPDGVHRVNYDGTTSPVNYTRTQLTEPWMYSTEKVDNMPYGPKLYADNERRATKWTPGVYDVTPKYKKVTLLPGISRVGKPVFVDIDPSNPEYYRIRVSGDSLVISCRPDMRQAVYRPFKTQVLDVVGNELPDVEIEDWPDMAWRGQHIDIARNYQTPESMRHVLDILSAARLNKLHFHVTDDEAWRLEIPGLPELTYIGSRRGYSDHGEDQYLYQIFAGDGNPYTEQGSANGYWTRRQFIDFIRDAKAMGIDVIPEIESPGHARAAIKAMEQRYRNGDGSYRLIHDGDTSVYTSAQSYHDNSINPALPGPYKFMTKVIDELIAMYRDAQVPLVGIHIGGDEVPRNAWAGSDSVRVFMEKHGLKNQHEMHGYFVRRIAKILRDRNVPMFGWEEIAVGYNDDFNREVAPGTGGVNVWHATSDAAVKGIKAGYPIILSNVNRFYFDMGASRHPEEQGLFWGGTVDEFDALGGYLADMCPVDTAAVPGKVLGVQGQLWAETIRCPQEMYAMLLPKIFGLAERGWNADSTYSEAQFNAIVGDRLMPILTKDDSELRVRMHGPGIKVEKGKVMMNAPYKGGVIRYTTDGTEPTEKSPVYTKPFKYKRGSDVRARYYRNNNVSLTTHLGKVK